VRFHVSAGALPPRLNASVTVEDETFSVSQAIRRPSIVSSRFDSSRQFARMGQPIAFTVAAGRFVRIATYTHIPKAASFDPTSGRFSWTPDASQAGQFDLVFTATNSAAASATPHVLIEVGSGRPLINDIRNGQPGTSGLSAWISACGAREKSTRTGRVSFFARERRGNHD
jgi:hypothetical protein